MTEEKFKYLNRTFNVDLRDEIKINVAYNPDHKNELYDIQLFTIVCIGYV